jgi:hypothetical protein
MTAVNNQNITSTSPTAVVWDASELHGDIASFFVRSGNTMVAQKDCVAKFSTNIRLFSVGTSQYFNLFIQGPSAAVSMMSVNNGASGGGSGTGAVVITPPISVSNGDVFSVTIENTDSDYFVAQAEYRSSFFVQAWDA